MKLRKRMRLGRSMMRAGAGVGAFMASCVGTKRPVAVQIGGRQIIVRTSTPDLTVARACLGGEFDMAIEAARPLRHGLIIDAGGYIGTAAIAFADAFPEALVISLEPSHENFAILEQNVAAYPNIVPLNVAVGVREGVTTLSARGTGEWGYTTVQGLTTKRGVNSLHVVPVVTIDGLLQEYGADGIDLLKMDIEGAEREIFSAPSDWLAATRVLTAELHDRFVPGCTASFTAACVNRRAVATRSEKVLSLQ